MQPCRIGHIAALSSCGRCVCGVVGYLWQRADAYSKRMNCPGMYAFMGIVDVSSMCGVEFS